MNDHLVLANVNYSLHNKTTKRLMRRLVKKMVSDLKK